MPIWAVPLITQLAPLLFAALAPVVTAILEAIGEKLGMPLPKPALPVINYGSGVALASAISGGAAANGLVVPLGVMGAMAGNRVREAITKGKKAALPPQ